MPSDDDYLDGCDLDFNDVSKNTANDQIAALALFADVDFLDPDAVERRRREWEELSDV